MTFRGVLLDLQGVLYHEGEGVAGAIEAVGQLRGRGLAIRFLTNTTTRPRREIVHRLVAMGFEVEPDQVFTPALAAARLLRQGACRRLHLAAPPGLAEDLEGFDLVEEAPQAVVMGDLHKGFTWERLDGIFRMLHEGACLVALHRNRFCRRGDALALDLGPFVAALEYATAKEALVVGKPARAFFRSALDDMDVQPGEAVMVGDDIEADIGGALSAGLKALQVKTGKYSPRDEDHPEIRPTDRLPSIAALPEWLSERGEAEDRGALQ